MTMPGSTYTYGLGHTQQYSRFYEPGWWDILGVPTTANKQQINAAFRKKAAVAHPDHGGSDEAMKRLLSAREKALRACS